MVYGADAPVALIGSDRRRRFGASAGILARTAPGAAVLALGALFGVWTLYLHPAPTPKAEVPSVEVARAEAPNDAPQTSPAAVAAANPFGALFDPRPSTGARPGSLAQSLPLQASLESAAPAPAGEDAGAQEPAPQFTESAPLPAPRPADLAEPAPAPRDAGRRIAQNSRTAPAPAAADNRSFFDKMFGAIAPAAQPPQPGGRVLAYAAPDDGLASQAQRVLSAPVASAPAAVGHEPGTAIYDISARTVYLPSGRQLEAHSGLGPLKDDPRYVHERMRGATPPSVYQLSVREQLFHGVKALRMTPVNGSGIYGRNGILAHTYMLGPNGDSNGCVSFKDYKAFLQAYENGEIKRLVVVARRG